MGGARGCLRLAAALAVLLSAAGGWGTAVLEAAAADEDKLTRFDRSLPSKAREADAVIVGERVLTMGDGDMIGLYRILEIIKGEGEISRAMTPHPELEGRVTIAYRDSLPPGRSEPAGRTLIFMVKPAAAGRNMRLLGGTVEEGMISALPALVDRTRSLCR